MSTEKNTNVVDEFVLSAVLEGVANAPVAFMAQLEEALRMDVAIAKSGSVDKYLQEMILAQMGEASEEEVAK
jgi:hypothetical protein